MRSLGIDVGVPKGEGHEGGKGYDVVVLDRSRSVVKELRHATLEQLRGIIHRIRPDVVAIDSPPWWASGGRSRATERTLRRAGILAFATPVQERGEQNRFYDWMRAGFESFRVAEESGYPRYRSGPVAQTAIEIFPHATAVTLAGLLGPSGPSKRPWRRGILEQNGIDGQTLRGPDQVDAALAALTGLLALEGDFCAPGDPDEGVIVLPVRSLRESRYLREET